MSVKYPNLSRQMEMTLARIYMQNRYNQGQLLPRTIHIIRRGMVARCFTDGRHLWIVTEKGINYIKEKELLKEFDNEERRRRYGIRVGDRVSKPRLTYEGGKMHNDGRLFGEVISIATMDNNSAIVLFDGEEKPTQCVAEWLTIEKKVEDRKRCPICDSTMHEHTFHTRVPEFFDPYKSDK